MSASIKDLLKPEILNSLNGLELIARVVVESFMSGSNKSKTMGTGQEFSQYRNYQSGDDLRQLDWKMYARSERYFVKQAEVETNITVKFFIDASNSMAYVENGVSKIDYAKIMCASLAYLARKQGDTYGLYSVNDQNTISVRPRFEQQQFMRLLYALISTKAAGKWKKGKEVEEFFDHHGKEIIIFITDLFDEDNDLQYFISRLKTTRNEVIVFHLLGVQELSLDNEGSYTFQDLETNATVKVETRTQKEQYKKQIVAWTESLRTFLLEKSITYQLVSMADPIEDVLRSFLKVRKGTM